MHVVLSTIKEAGFASVVEWHHGIVLLKDVCVTMRGGP